METFPLAFCFRKSHINKNGGNKIHTVTTYFNRLIIFQWMGESSFEEKYLEVLYVLAIRGPFSYATVAGTCSCLLYLEVNCSVHQMHMHVVFLWRKEKHYLVIYWLRSVHTVENCNLGLENIVFGSRPWAAISKNFQGHSFSLNRLLSQKIALK